ncbi:MAG: hypothetical protein IK081_01695 [Lachnospiraceae bacterium]|nr:hypothetical protein [Lachnospiraceae bacterium]
MRRKGNGEKAPDEGRSYAALGRRGMERKRRTREEVTLRWGAREWRD